MDRKTIYMMSAEDLEAVIRKVMNESGTAHAKPEAEEYLSISEVISRLGVSRTTLWRWENSSYLKPSRIGGKVRYRASEINELFDNKNRLQ